MKKNVSTKMTISRISEEIQAKLILRSNVNPETLYCENISELDKATQRDISFIASEKYIGCAAKSKAQAIIVSEHLTTTLPKDVKALLVVENVWAAIIKLLPFFHNERKREYSIHPSSVIAGKVKIGKNVGIGPLTVVEEGAVIEDNAVIGAQCYLGENVYIRSNSIIYPNVKILSDTVIGKNCIIHSGVALGVDGFRYEIINNKPHKIPQIGNVVIGDNVEIGANTCIDRAFLGSTKIGAGTKIDNLVQIGHNCEIGMYNGLAGQVGIAGSVKTGTGVICWAQAGIADHLYIADYSVIGAKSGVMSSIKDTNSVFGIPAIGKRQYLKMISALRKLPTYMKKKSKQEEEA